MKKPIRMRARRMTDDLRARIDSHGIWLRTKGAKGKRLSYGSELGMNLARQCLTSIKGRHASFMFCNLDGADLSGADLFHADFGDSTCRGTNFCGANLREATFSGVDLTGANLTRAVLDDCIAIGADFTNAIFSRTSMLGSLLGPPRTNRGMRSYIENLHARGLIARNRSPLTTISQAQIDQCRCDRSTDLPPGLPRKFNR